MDGDIFGAVTRLGRDAAEGVARAIQGDAWDPFLAARCIEVLIAKAGGIPSAPAVIRELRAVKATPLLATALMESSIERIDDAVREAKGTVLDLMLRSAAQRCLLRGEHEPRAMLQQFCAELLDRSILSGRGGLLEKTPHSHREAIAILAPVAAQAAGVLEARPEAKRLSGVGCTNLPMCHAQVSAQGTRAMHPRTIALFNELLRSVLDRPVRAIAPFFLLTKTRPTLAPRPQPPQKEKERDLFTAAG